MELTARRAAGLACGAVVACGAYAALRLVDAGDEGPGVVFATARVPYYWRAAAAVVIGAVAGLLAATGLSEGEGEALLRRTGLVWLVVLVAAGAVVLVP